MLIGRCDTIVGEDGAVNELTIETRAVIEEIKNVWSSQGKRVILLARKVLPAAVIDSSPASNDFEREAMEHARSSLTLVGLIAIVDPPVSQDTLSVAYNVAQPVGSVKRSPRSFVLCGAQGFGFLW